MSDIEIHDYSTGAQPPVSRPGRWSTAEMQQEFELIGFAAPYVVVKRKSDGQKGTLEFTHSPRVYFDFKEV